jgi:hypothetical protein
VLVAGPAADTNPLSPGGKIEVARMTWAETGAAVSARLARTAPQDALHG